jgi:hypothetical protein
MQKCRRDSKTLIMQQDHDQTEEEVQWEDWEVQWGLVEIRPVSMEEVVLLDSQVKDI